LFLLFFLQCYKVTKRYILKRQNHEPITQVSMESGLTAMADLLRPTRV
jgi:hypothetical protein